MTKTTGSCLCGQVTYETEAEPALMINCHCESCRKASGSAYMTNVMFKEDSITVTGETREFTHKSDAGSDMTKVNCSTCCSPIYGKNTARPGMLVFRAGTLDGGVAYAAKMNIFLDSAMPDTAMNPELKTAGRMPG